MRLAVAVQAVEIENGTLLQITPCGVGFVPDVDAASVIGLMPSHRKGGYNHIREEHEIEETPFFLSDSAHGVLSDLAP